MADMILSTQAILFRNGHFKKNKPKSNDYFEGPSQQTYGKDIGGEGKNGANWEEKQGKVRKIKEMENGEKDKEINGIKAMVSQSLYISPAFKSNRNNY